MNDTRSILLVNDNLKKVDQAWEESLMALEMGPEEDLLEGLYHRRLDKSITILLKMMTIFSSN